MASDQEPIGRSHNPWQFPTTVRQCLLTPCQSARVSPPLVCDTPLADAVAIPCRPGTLLTLANHTLQPLPRLELRWRSSKTVAKVESVRLGAIPFDVVEDGCVRFTLPLEASDFVLVTEP